MTEIDEKSSYVKFKYGKIKFEIVGSENFITNIFSSILDSNIINTDLIDQLMDDDQSNEAELQEIPENEFNVDSDTAFSVPFDKFKEVYNFEKPQDKTLTSILYFSEVLKKDKVRGRDINKLLADNKYSPISNITNQVTRLRKKGLISLTGKSGSEDVYSIYKDNIEKVKDHLKKE